MCEPHWNSLAYVAIKDVVSRPSILVTMTKVFDMTETDFLLEIQSHAIPWLVLNKKKDVIWKVADILLVAPWRLVMDHISAVLALLFVQEVEDVQAYAQDCLLLVSPDFTMQLPLLIKTNPSPLALELLKMTADLKEERKLRVSCNPAPFWRL